MSKTTTQTPANENAAAETHDQGSEDAAVAALLKSQEPETKTETEAEPADESEPESDAEPVEGETEEDPEATDELVEAELDGKTYKVPAAVEKALLRQADYSRKMNAVAAEQKAVTQSKETADRLLEGAEKFAEALAEVKQIDARLKSFDSVQWQQLRVENPAEYAALSADLNTLRLTREDKVRGAQGIEAQIREAKGKAFAAKREEMLAVLQKDLKGWGDDLGTKITQYAIETGYTREEVAQLTDPKTVIALNKAMKYDALQKGKPALKAKVQDVPPVLKRGTPTRADPSRDAFGKFRETRSEADAIKALLSLSR